MHVDFHPAALREVEDAQAWYEARSLLAASAFLRELSVAVQRIQQAPHLLTFSSIALVVSLSPTLAASQDRPPEQDRAALTQIQQDQAKAWVSGDRGTIERIVAPEWRSTGPDGRSSDRASVFADVFEKRVHRIRRLQIDDVRVQMFGDAAVVTGRTQEWGFRGHAL